MFLLCSNSWFHFVVAFHSERPITQLPAGVTSITALLGVGAKLRLVAPQILLYLQ